MMPNSGGGGGQVWGAVVSGIVLVIVMLIDSPRNLEIETMYVSLPL